MKLLYRRIDAPLTSARLKYLEEAGVTYPWEPRQTLVALQEREAFMNSLKAIREELRDVQATECTGDPYVDGIRALKEELRKSRLEAIQARQLYEEMHERGESLKDRLYDDFEQRKVAEKRAEKYEAALREVRSQLLNRTPGEPHLSTLACANLCAVVEEALVWEFDLDKKK